MISSIRPSSASACSRAADCGAARNLARRWTTITRSATSASDKAQSTAESRIPRNVVDRLFRIERGALPTGRRQRVEDMAAQIEHAAFENRKQPHRPGADDRDIAALES